MKKISITTGILVLVTLYSAIIGISLTICLGAALIISFFWNNDHPNMDDYEYEYLYENGEEKEERMERAKEEGIRKAYIDVYGPVLGHIYYLKSKES